MAARRAYPSHVQLAIDAAEAKELDTRPPAVPGTVWRLWFPSRLGPTRKQYRRVNGEQVVTRGKTLELPPTKNTRGGNPHAHNTWVQVWRDAACEAAKDVIPPCARIRISAEVHRERIGIADAENDHARLAPLQDGLVDAHVIPKDTYRFCERGLVTERRAGANGPGVLLIVEALQGEGDS